MNNSAGFPIVSDKKLQELGMRGPRVKTNFTDSYKKTPEERKHLKAARETHYAGIRAAGQNPKKVMNIKIK